MVDLTRALALASPEVRGVLEHCLADRELSEAQALSLSEVTGGDLTALCAAADEMRRRQCGDQVAYVVNRNINFTNVCVMSCRFCAFSRDLRSEQGYLLDLPEIVRRAREARAFGATELCLQAGLLPNAKGRLYLELIETLKRELPELHLHAYSPEEVRYGARLTGLSIADYLLALKERGLDSLPGTSAEILDDDLRARISPGRISTAQWIEVITTAHRLGIATTSTMMFGHLESAAARVRHLALLRAIQRETGGFTEFVPLFFIRDEAPLFLEHAPPELARAPDAAAVLRVYALARLMLGSSIRNLQVSWVKHGLPLAQRLLEAGGNDLGGTLMNESISTAAGAEHGQLVTPRRLREAILALGRTPVQRSTLYAPIRVFGAADHAAPEPLDAVADASAQFGTYHELLRDPRFRYQERRAHRRLPVLELALDPGPAARRQYEP